MSNLLKIARGLELDPDYIGGGTFALLGKKGAGKSFTTRVLAEEFWDHHVPFALVDPMGANWGLRSSADGKHEGIPVPIFGGKHGDAPLERTAGAVMADLLIEGLSMILDLSELGSRAAERQFGLDFFERLYRNNSTLVHVLLDEADLFAPQKPAAGDQPLLGVTENIVRRGRNRGIAITLISQRPAVVNKDVLTQVDGLWLLRITSPQDREAARTWMEAAGEPDEVKAVTSSLATLKNGEAWVWIPELQVFKRVQVRMARTFDSSPTRKRGGRLTMPKGYADVDMAAISDRIAGSIERAKAEDPKQLRKQIADLKRERDRRPTETKVETVTQTVEVPVLSDEAIAALGDVVDELSGVAGRLVAATNEVAGGLGKLKTRPAVAAPVPRPAPTPERSPAPQPPTRSEPVGDDDVRLKAGARRMLTALASLYPAWLTRPQVGTLAKVKHTGGTFGDYLSALRTAGAVEENGSGRSAELRITERGFELLGSEAPAPATTEELLAMWRDRLKKGAREMLDALVDAYPDYLSREELAQAPERPLEMSGGTFGDYLSMLRRTGLIEEDGRQVRAAETLFLGATA